SAQGRLAVEVAFDARQHRRGEVDARHAAAHPRQRQQESSSPAADDQRAPAAEVVEQRFVERQVLVVRRILGVVEAGDGVVKANVWLHASGYPPRRLPGLQKAGRSVAQTARITKLRGLGD